MDYLLLKRKFHHISQRVSLLMIGYKEEIDMLSRLSEKNLAGVITTNSDNFLENHCNGYTVYVGQKELIFSAIQGVAEIFN